MWGKHFESMYKGSMYGAGLNVFAVWGYVISHMHFGSVELNPEELSHVLGGTVEEIEAAIEYLTTPKLKSRHKEHEGRHMVKEGEFQYAIPSWKHYETIRNELHRQEQNRVAQAKHRARAKSGKLSAGEQEYVKAQANGASREDLDRIVSKHLPGAKGSDAALAGTPVPEGLRQG